MRSCILFIKTEPLAFEDLSASRQKNILAAAALANIHPQQAISLRSQLLHSAVPFRFTGSESLALEAANALEDEVAQFLTRCGVSHLTQEQQTAIVSASIAHPLDRQGIPTPDFIMPGGVIIHGQRVFWIEVKRFFGTGVSCMKRWMPVYRVPEQTRKYIQHFGPGALLFITGHAQRLETALPEGVVLLDGSVFHDFSKD